MNNLNIVTGCNSVGIKNGNYINYFDCLCSLLSSLNKLNRDGIKDIYVFDFGLNTEDRNTLDGIPNIYIEHIDKEYEYIIDCMNIPERYKMLGPFKSAAKKKMDSVLSEHDNILWLDAGVIVNKSIHYINYLIDKYGIFTIYLKNFVNRFHFGDSGFKIINATEEEKDQLQVCSGVLGWRCRGKYSHLIHDIMYYQTYPECLYDEYLGNKFREQTILSILSYRYGVLHNDHHDFMVDGKTNDTNYILYGSRGRFINKDYLYDYV